MNTFMRTRIFKSYKAIFVQNKIDKNQTQEIKFYKNDEYKFTINKNFHYDDLFKTVLLEWFEYNNKTLIVLNAIHGLLSIFDAETGVLVHCTINDNMFLADYKLLDDREYMYMWGWCWSLDGVLKTPIRSVYHIPDLFSIPEYEPKYIKCIDVKKENYMNPGINLFGCSVCKDFLEKYDDIFCEIKIESRTEEFNKNRISDTLLRRFLETHGLVEFENDSKQLLEDILMSDRDIFTVKVYDDCKNKGYMRGKHTNNYDYSLFTKIDSSCLLHHNINLVIASKIFHNFIDGLPFNDIDLKFEIYSDLGNLIIWIRHQLIPCDKIKNMHDGIIPEFFKNHVHKIDPWTKLNIRCVRMCN